MSLKPAIESVNLHPTEQLEGMFKLLINLQVHESPLRHRMFPCINLIPTGLSLQLAVIW